MNFQVNGYADLPIFFHQWVGITSLEKSAVNGATVFQQLYLCQDTSLTVAATPPNWAAIFSWGRRGGISTNFGA